MKLYKSISKYQGIRPLRYFQYLCPLLVLVTVWSSCTKDHSNTELNKINEVGLSDSTGLNTITVVMNDSLFLNPEVEASVSGAELTYSWDVYDNSPASEYTLPRTVIANTRTLRYQIHGSPFTVGHQYLLRFKTTDKKSGVSTYLYYQLNIVGNYDKGWLLLEDNKGQLDLSLMQSDINIFHHLYSGLASYVPLGTPRRVYVGKMAVTDDLADPGKRLYLLGSNGIVQLSYTSMEVELTQQTLFFNAPVMNPEYIQWASYISGASIYGNNGVIFNDHKLYYNLTGGFPGEKRWGGMLTSDKDGINYSLYPFMASTSAYSAPVAKTAYDNLNKKFLQVTSSGLVEISSDLSTPSIFMMNSVGLTMVYMDSSNTVDEWSCLMKDSDEKGYYLRFSTKSDVTKVTLKKQAIQDATVIKGKNFTSSTLTPHIFYTQDNSIWRYEITSNTTKKCYDLPAGEEITRMFFDRNYLLGSSKPTLMVATYKGEEGKLYYFSVSDQGDIGQPVKTLGGFDKIVDIAYKVTN